MESRARRIFNASAHLPGLLGQIPATGSGGTGEAGHGNEVVSMEFTMLARAWLEAARKWEEENAEMVEKKCPEHSDRMPSGRSRRVRTLEKRGAIQRTTASTC